MPKSRGCSEMLGLPCLKEKTIIYSDTHRPRISSLLKVLSLYISAILQQPVVRQVIRHGATLATDENDDLLNSLRGYVFAQVNLLRHSETLSKSLRGYGRDCRKRELVQHSHPTLRSAPLGLAILVVLRTPQERMKK